jgi:hypothetical protein
VYVLRNIDLRRYLLDVWAKGLRDWQRPHGRLEDHLDEVVRGCLLVELPNVGLPSSLFPQSLELRNLRRFAKLNSLQGKCTMNMNTSQVQGKYTMNMNTSQVQGKCTMNMNTSQVQGKCTINMNTSQVHNED